MSSIEFTLIFYDQKSRLAGQIHLQNLKFVESIGKGSNRAIGTQIFAYSKLANADKNQENQAIQLIYSRILDDLP